jgi:hypothetical protein
VIAPPFTVTRTVAVTGRTLTLAVYAPSRTAETLTGSTFSRSIFCAKLQLPRRTSAAPAARIRSHRVLPMAPFCRILPADASEDRVAVPASAAYTGDDISDWQNGEEIGSHFRWAYKMAGLRFEGETTLVEFVRNRRVVTEGRGAIRSRWQFDYTPVP